LERRKQKARINTILRGCGTGKTTVWSSSRGFLVFRRRRRLPRLALSGAVPRSRVDRYFLGARRLIVGHLNPDLEIPGHQLSVAGIIGRKLACHRYVMSTGPDMATLSGVSSLDAGLQRKLRLSVNRRYKPKFVLKRQSDSTHIIMSAPHELWVSRFPRGNHWSYSSGTVATLVHPFCRTPGYRPA